MKNDRVEWGCGFALGGAKMSRIASLTTDLGESVLEIGCGLGFVIGHTDAPNRFGVDKEPEQIKYASTTYPTVQFKAALADATGYESCTFDSILCLDILEHLEDDGAALKEAWRILRVGGKIIVSTPIRGVDLMPYAKRQTNELHKSWGHVRVYSLQEIKDLLEKNGFKVSKTQPYARLSVRAMMYLYFKILSRYLTNTPTDQNAAKRRLRLLQSAERTIQMLDRLERILPFGRPFQVMMLAYKG